MIQTARSRSFVTSSPTAPASNAFGAVIPLFLREGWGLPIGQQFDSMLLKKLSLQGI